MTSTRQNLPTDGQIVPIASNFDVDRHITRDGSQPKSTASQPTGNFRTICQFSHLSYDDPILYPGQVGASPHLHMFFGNSAADANSTYSSLRTSGDGTCDGGPINRTAYWAPAVFNAQGKVVIPDFITVYYKGENTSSLKAIQKLPPIPIGLRMVAGYSASNPTVYGNDRFDWYCEQATNDQKTKTIPNCPSDQRVGVHLDFPSCWDGRNIDSPDHRSHLAYAYYGENGVEICPPDHPLLIPTVEIGIWFTHDGDSKDWYLSSDRMPGMTVIPNGSSFHSDWFGAWDPTVMSNIVKVCINGALDCQGGQLGEGTSLSQVPNEYAGPKLIVPPPHP